MAVIEITDKNFEEEVLHSDKPVLLDFWASWCMPCKMLSPVIEEISEEDDSIKVGKINIDEQPELRDKFRIMSIPTIMVFKDGKNIDQKVGVQPKEKILAMLES